MHEIDPLITEYEHEKFRPREAEALESLRKVASLVKPIMRQRGWRVGILTEFWPPEKNLLGLNWNKGQKICLRLRYPYDERQFIPLEEVVDTMLHELCHIVHGPHDEPFHTLWNQLRTEHEQLLRQGYTGEGFLSEGRKLGGARIPKHEARRQARLAAEKRKTLNAGSGQKLGGTGVRRGEDIRKVIADAAQRRATVTRGCASGTDRGRGIVEETNKNGFRTKAENDDENDEAIMLAYIDLIEEEEREKYGDAYVPTSSENPAGSQGAVPRPAKPSKSNDHPPIPPPAEPNPFAPLIDLTSSAPPYIPPSDGSWTCDICTLVNPSTYLCCDACSTERPTPPSSPKLRPSSRPGQTPPPKKGNSLMNKKSAVENLKIVEKAAAAKPKGPMGWLCHNCGNWMESEWWTCAGCGQMKLRS